MFGLLVLCRNEKIYYIQTGLMTVMLFKVVCQMPTKAIHRQWHGNKKPILCPYIVNDRYTVLEFRLLKHCLHLSKSRIIIIKTFGSVVLLVKTVGLHKTILCKYRIRETHYVSWSYSNISYVSKRPIRMCLALNVNDFVFV